MPLFQIAILTAMEFLSLMLLICKATSNFIKPYWKEILIYAPIYIFLGISSIFINYIFVLTSISISVVIFIKVAFIKKLRVAMLVCLISLFLSTIVLQTITTSALGMYLSGPVEFTFWNGIIAMSLALILAKLCYLYLPLNKIVHKLSEPRRYYFLTVVFVVLFLMSFVMKFFVSPTVPFELLPDRRVMTDLMLFAFGVSFALIAIGYTAIRFIRRKNEKKSALKRFKAFEDLPIGPPVGEGTDLLDYEKHLEVIGCLSLLSDDKRTTWYVQNYLNNFDLKDGEENEFHDDCRARLLDLEDKVLAAYLYVKIKHLRSLGINCKVRTRHFSTSSKMDTYNLLNVLDILIDEALVTSDKERSDLRIIITRLDNRRPVIDIFNRNDLVSGQDTLRMVFESYSLKTKKVNGLRKLDKIIEEHDCRLSLEDKVILDGKYLKLSYLL